MRSPWMAGLLGAVLGAGLMWGTTSGRAAEPVKLYDQDAAEMDRTAAVLSNRIVGLNTNLKDLAKTVNAQNFADPDKKFEAKLQETFQATVTPLFEDAAVLLVQTYLLALDNAADTGGDAVQAAMWAEIAKRTGVEAKELKAQAEKNNMGLGGVALTHAIAKAAKVPASEIFANKADNKSWPEVMRARQVTFAQLQAVLDEKKE